MKLYDTVKHILISYPDTRNSDKALIGEVLRHIGAVRTVDYFGDTEAVLLDRLLSGSIPSFESITRARRKVQELHIELEATSSEVRIARNQKQSTKGAFIYTEEL